MQITKTVVAVFIMVCLIFPVEAQCVVGVVITPSNVVLPTTAGEIFSFDFLVLSAMTTNGTSFKATISVSGPGSLTIDKPNSAAVTSESIYWVYGNSYGVIIGTPDGNSCSFEDNPLNGIPEPLAADDIMARYAFIWDGTEGDYTFVLNLSTNNSFIQDGAYVKESLGFSPGSYPGTSDRFAVNIPEPSTLFIFVLGGAALLKKRST
jgi:hypothetical protein